MASIGHEDGERLQGLAEIQRYMVGVVDTMALKCAVDLRIADIINSHSPPAMTLPQIATAITAASSSLDMDCLERFMRWLVQRRIFSVSHPADGGDAVYGLTKASRWLLHDTETTMAPFITMMTQHWWTSPWLHFAQRVQNGDVSAFKRAFGVEFYEFESQDAEVNTIFNKAMVSQTSHVSKAVVSGYKDGFNSIGSLVDVGGGIGCLASQIAKSYPHIKVTNFDLPHVVATAPDYDGTVTHVGGDMFKSFPKADAILLKWVFHNWGDEYCVEVLKNCKKAIPEKTGKIIIVEVVVQPEAYGLHDDVVSSMDLAMAVNTCGGRERTEAEWKKLLEAGGFPSYKIVKIPAMESIIEAYPY